MRWKGRQKSTNVEDRRRSEGKRRPGRRKAVGGLSIGVLVIIVVVALLGGDPTTLLDQSAQAPVEQNYSQPRASTAQNDKLADFVSVVLKDTEDAWRKIFHEQVEGAYRNPKMVLFTESVSSACGMANAATGPFYCPGDEKLYIDLSFYDDLKNKFGAPGDFAMAYVIAHEVGHHVQNILGTLDDVHRQQRRMSKKEANRMSVMLELQADFYAGVWARYTQDMKDVLEKGDLEEAINAAEAIGDDRLQKQAKGYIVPESFTHGTSAQRMRWYKKGFKTGNLKDGDTFSARKL